jgi:hypothetical protein
MKSFARTAILFCLVWLLLSTHAFSQIGIKGGLNLASQRQGGFTQQGSQAGFLAGVLFPIRINNRFTLQPEVLFIQKGGKKERESEYGGSFLVTTKMNNIDLILVSKIHLGDMNTLSPHLLFGPYLSYLISGQYLYGDGEVTEDIEDYHKLEFGYTVGFGTDIRLGSSQVYLDARFSHSLTDIHITPSHIWNKGFSFSVGYFF